MEPIAQKRRPYFITGLLIVVPVLITIYLFVSLFGFFDNILGRYVSRLTVAYFGIKIPGLGLLFFLALILSTGFVATNLIGRKIFLSLERFWVRFPLVKMIYPAAKRVTNFLFSPQLQGKLQKVVLIEYPSKGFYTLAFLTNETDQDIRAKAGVNDLLNVLVPTVPNPITGFLIFVPRRHVIFLDIAVEDAVKMMMSGGVLNPKDAILGHAEGLMDSPNAEESTLA